MVQRIDNSKIKKGRVFDFQVEYPTFFVKNTIRKNFLIKSKFHYNDQLHVELPQQ